MKTNSAIFTTTIFGKSSGMTKEDLVNKDLNTIETYTNNFRDSNLRIKIPKIPSNQRIAKDPK